MANRAPDMRLKKQKKPKQVPKLPLIYMLSTGTPNQMGPPKGYPAEKNAKEWAIKSFEVYREWCKRHNKVGEEAIDAAIAEVQALPVLLTGQTRRVTCLVDDYTGLTLCVDLWRKDE